MITINKITVNIFQEHSYIVYDENKQGVLIDPGCSCIEELNNVNKYIIDNNITIKSIWQTHLHFDHILGTKYFAEKYGINPICHKSDLPMIDINKAMAQQWGIDIHLDDFKFNKFITDGDELYIGNDKFVAFHVPGHSPGGVAYYSEQNHVCFCGDSIFRLSIGRSDLPGGDEQTLIDSIKNKLFVLPDDTLLCCGHGPESSIAFEKANNPYLK